MADEPEIKEDDPVEAIRAALQRALASLQKLLGKEDQELQEELEEAGDGIGSGSQPVQDPPADNQQASQD